MDRLTRTANIIKAYYSYKKDSDAATFVKEVCGFFDFMKNEPISEADMNFLIFLANEAGIPQYFDLFKDKFTDCRISDVNIKTLTISALFHDASLIRGNSKLHRYQKNVLDSFKIGQKNRFVLTAPTSFGKTFLVYEIIQKMQYQNVLFIFPAISLLSENYARLCKLDIFQSYKIHSLSEEEFCLSERTSLFLHQNGSYRLWIRINTFTLILPLLMRFTKLITVLSLIRKHLVKTNVILRIA